MRNRVLLVSAFLLLATVCIPATAQQSQATSRRDAHVGLPVDWSFRHLVTSRAVDRRFTGAARQEPRVLNNWFYRRSAALSRAKNRKLRGQRSRVAIDWNFSLGTGRIAPNMYPAKYSFDINATPTCTDNLGAGVLADFVVYGLDNATVNTVNPNLVAFKKLYINPLGMGSCSGTTPDVKFAYAINTIGGRILTSPALSLDGNKVAFIESSATGSRFHVLTIGTAGGTTAGSFSLVLATYSAVVPGTLGDNGVLSSTPVGAIANNVTNSSPWIDYGNDVGYFGDDNGRLYKTTCVFFCVASPAIAANWPITVANGVVLTGPVLNGSTNDIYVGGSNGNLYRILLPNCPLGAGCVSATVAAVGSAGANGGIVDPPIVDGTFQTVFAVSGNNGANAVVRQYDRALTQVGSLNMSVPGGFDIHSPSFDDAYYSNAIGSPLVTSRFYACGPRNPSGQPALYTVPMTSSGGNLSLANPPVLGAGTPLNLPGNARIPCSPMAELKNGAVDRLFFSQSSPASINSYNISGATPVALNTAAETGGTSAIVVDNVSANAEASSIYFSTQGTSLTCPGTGIGSSGFCAVKLTQSALQ